MRSRDQIEAAIRAIASEIREQDGPGSDVPGMMEVAADLYREGPMDHADLLRVLMSREGEC